MSDTGEPVHILLVEDNPGDVRLTREAFREGRINNDLHVVSDGEAALDYLHQRGEYESAQTPDLILLDLNIPRLDGLELLERIRDDPELSHLPVVVLTSSEAEEDVIKSYELHSNAYLTKPVNHREFVDLVRTFEEFWFELVRFPPKG